METGPDFLPAGCCGRPPAIGKCGQMPQKRRRHSPCVGLSSTLVIGGKPTALAG